MLKKILIVVDMQNDFITGSLGTPEAQAIVENVCKEISTYNYYKIFYTMDTHNRNYGSTLEGELLPVEHCIEDSTGWAMNDSVLKAVNDELIYRERVKKGTFGYTGWKGALDDLGDVEITLVGVCTDICVVSNALILRALFPNAIIKVKANCCAGTTPEKHKAALEVMKSCQIEVVE